MRHTDEERFYAKVDKSADCYLWTGKPDEDGYGKFGTGPRTKRVTWRAHRWAWAQAHGPIPAGVLICHTCDVPLCVRLSHLYAGTPLSNMHDKVERGRARTRRGADRRWCKITDAQVEEIRARYAAGSVTQAVLAQEFGCAQTLVSRIVRQAARC